jgi:hypothetical protein
MLSYHQRTNIETYSWRNGYLTIKEWGVLVAREMFSYHQRTNIETYSWRNGYLTIKAWGVLSALSAANIILHYIII